MKSLPSCKLLTYDHENLTTTPDLLLIH